MKHRSSQNFAILFLSAAVLLRPGVVFSHDFEPGYVERSVDVVIRDQRLQISYAIGLGDITMLDWLLRAQHLDHRQAQRFRRLIEDYESANGRKNSPSSSSETAEPKPDSAMAGDTVEPAQFQKELADLFKTHFSKIIASNLQLSYDDRALELADVVLVDTARHHVILEMRLVAEIPKRESGVLRLLDANFLEKVGPKAAFESGSNSVEKSPMAEPAIVSPVALQKDTGDSTVSEPNQAEPTVAGEQTAAVGPEAPHFRYHGKVRRACRAKGAVVLVNSNVAPVLARAEAADVGQLDRQERVVAATIEATLAFAVPESR